MMERSVTGVASLLLRSVEGIRVGDGGAHGTVGRLEPRAIGRQTMGAHGTQFKFSRFLIFEIQNGGLPDVQNSLNFA
jgi:hypothetical protein